MKKVEVKNLKEFRQFVTDEVIPLIKPQTLFLLIGDLGAGKTELVKVVADFFKMQNVQSPTFAFHQAYENSSIKIHHVDLYRLQNEEDLESTGFWDLFENENDVIFVEWANLVLADAWPWDWKQVHIEIKKAAGDGSINGREILIRFPQA